MLDFIDVAYKCAIHIVSPRVISPSRECSTSKRYSKQILQVLL